MKITIDSSELIELALHAEKIKKDIEYFENKCLHAAGAPTKRKPVKEFRTGDKVTKIKRK
jgi:hypothetical protein